ncbi:MAG: class F sortase [Micrococcales bacterium]|nr:class F sortase [Micrococcales bacterium]
MGSPATPPPRPRTPAQPSRRRDAARRRYARLRRTGLAVLVVGALAVLVALAVSRRGPQPGEYVAPNRTSHSATTATTRSSAASTKTGATAKSPYVLRPKGTPTFVRLTAVGGRRLVDADLTPAHLDDQAVLAPPFGQAGWYAEKGWAKPGWPSAAILVGHINHGSKADVFWNLPRAKAGDAVTVAFSSGQATRFVVSRSEAVSKTEVPQRKDIWAADSTTPLLRLITCDPTTPLESGHYEGDWVVWATPAV